MTTRAKLAAKRTRIQEQNEQKILDAALEQFGNFGFRGATIDQIALAADMSKPNLLYYFKNKKDLYSQVMIRTLDAWLLPLAKMDPDGDPLDEIWGYAREKLELSRQKPAESRLFAMEILQGAPMLKGALETTLKDQFNGATVIFQRWIDQGRLAPIDPQHLLFMLWAMTQTYADFWVQIETVSDQADDRDLLFDRAKHTLHHILTKGLAPEG